MRLLVRRLCTWRALGILLVAVSTTLLARRSFDAQVARAFEAADSASPSRVYSRPLVLRPGDRESAARVARRLERSGYVRTSARRPGVGQFRLEGREWRIGRRALRIGAFFDDGGETTLRLDRSGRIRDISDAGGSSLSGIVIDPEPVATFLGNAGRDRVPVRLADIPDHLVRAVLTVEDRRFREHSGLDPRRIGGAILANIRQGRLVQGGSTLTQQLARTLFLDRDRTLIRKLREAAIARALERRFSKDRILEAYLNHIYLGQDGGAAIHGVGRAAGFFFGKDVTELTIEESATLAGIIRGPSVYSPHRHPERARSRRDLVLRLMAGEGHLTPERLETALGVEPTVEPRGRSGPDGRWYFDYLERELARSAPGDPGGAGYTLIATLEPALQEAAERVVSRGLGRIERLRPRLADQASPLQAALVAIDPATGEILAMVGGRSYAGSQFNRATEAARQPGSAFKPVVTLAALQRGGERPFTLASTLDDEPLRLDTPSGVWSPANSDREFMGPVSLRTALEESRNVPFARLGIQIGPERIVETARRLGIESTLAPYPSLALGASEVTLLELTGAYAVLAAEGRRVGPHAIRSALDAGGERLDAGAVDPVAAFSPAEAYLVTSALAGVVDEGTGRAVRDLGYRGDVAAKSGTTNGSRDAWFVGYTPELAVGVWVGFDDGTPVGLTGSQAALPIFTEFLVAALGPDGGARFSVPDGLEWRELRAAAGRGRRCGGEAEVFLAGTAPRDACGRWNRFLRGSDRWGDRDGLEAAERWLRSRLYDLERSVRIESEGRRRGSRRDR